MLQNMPLPDFPHNFSTPDLPSLDAQSTVSSKSRMVEAMGKVDPHLCVFITSK